MKVTDEMVELAMKSFSETYGNSQWMRKALEAALGDEEPADTRTPRRWPIGSPEPKEKDLRVRGEVNGVIFKRMSWGQWLALSGPDSGGDNQFYTWPSINSDLGIEGGQAMEEVL